MSLAHALSWQWSASFHGLQMEIRTRNIPIITPVLLLSSSGPPADFQNVCLNNAKLDPVLRIMQLGFLFDWLLSSLPEGHCVQFQWFVQN